MIEEEWVVGKHPVLEALRSGRTINKIWIANSVQKNVIQPIVNQAQKTGIIVQHVDKRKLDQLVTGISHQGVVAQVAPYAYVEVEHIVSAAHKKEQLPFLLLLDEIEDPHNLGAMLRTAECTGVHGVIVPKRRSAAVTMTVSKISAGAAEYVPVARVNNLGQTIDRLKQAGLWIVGMDVGASDEVFNHNILQGPIAVVIGNEQKGIGRLIREKCDVLLKLPTVGTLNSLNASVAAAIVMYEVLRTRKVKTE